MTSLAAVVPLGLVVGVVLGALGGGGAILTVPILVYVVGQSPSSATVGSLVIVTLIALVGLATHFRAGRVRAGDGLLFGAVGSVGSVMGSGLSSRVSGDVLMTAFAVLMLVVAVLMFRRGRRTGSTSAGARRGVPAIVATATGVGFLTGFFGVGGGFAVVPALVLALGYAMPTAVATSLVVIVVNSVVALAARAAGGVEIAWLPILAFSACGAVGSLLGAQLSTRLEPERLMTAFAVLLVFVAAFVLTSTLLR